jgi:hypothetical protein
MDHDGIVAHLRDRGKGVIENIMQAPDLQSVASASLAIFAQLRPVARAILQAKIALEAQQRMRADVTPGGQEAGATLVQTRTVSPETLFGEISIPGRTFQCRGGGATFRPDDTALGVPDTGDFTDDGRDLYAPLAAELPPRVANTRFAQCTGVPLSSCGAQAIIDSTAEHLRTWQAERESRETEAVGEAVAVGDGGAELRVEIARDGVMAPIDGRWQDANGGPLLVRQLEAQPEAPTLGVVLARRDVGSLGSADDLAVRLTQAMREAGWAHISVGEILGDGAPWSWTVADAPVPGVRQTLDSDHLSEPL